jgi:hypothetical protein
MEEGAWKEAAQHQSHVSWIVLGQQVNEGADTAALCKQPTQPDRKAHKPTPPSALTAASII